MNSALATERLAHLRARIDECMLADVPELRRRLAGLSRRVANGKPVDRGLNALQELVDRSASRAASRQSALPGITFPAELPLSGRVQDISELLQRHQVLVVCGETGSGKTTQIPKLCLAMGRGVRGMIGHTQPRRIAARSVAARIAEEIQEQVGGAVGYKIRFGDHCGPNTAVKLMTDGILLAEIQSDPALWAYDTLIIDEAHERSLNIDFLLGYLRRLLPRRPDLKVIITSATIDPDRFARHFNNAPVVNVSGRTYPVELRYRPLASEQDAALDRTQTDAILDAVDELAAEGPGDVLVFLSGEREIRETAEALRKHHPPATEILPLYARLSAAEQNRVFQKSRSRRIVLATNVAETSLTVPGIRYVVDPGRARISRYSLRSKVQRLPVESISQASANQRAGRCGRVSAGVCIRLYSEADFQSRPPFTDPEILRTNLGSVILQMIALGLGEVEAFPFVEPPDSKQISDGYRLLHELGAVDTVRAITPLGRTLARLPIDPRLGRILVAGAELGCLSETLVIVAALSVQDPRERPLEARVAADEAHARFQDPKSDFVAWLKLWTAYREQQAHLSNSKLRHLCRAWYLSWLRMREWQDIHRQLRALSADLKMKSNSEPADYAVLHRALLCGLASHVGLRAEDRSYQGARACSFHLFPGSGIKPPKWVVAAELVQTSRLFARTAARVQPEWIEAAAGHLVKRSHHNPRWDDRGARVVADERATLYGLVLFSARKVGFGSIDPDTCRRIFIEDGLVGGRLKTAAPFLAHNQALVHEIQQIEDKSRRRDVLVDESVQFDFYDQRLPADINDGVRFERWNRRIHRQQPDFLLMSRSSLLQRAPDDLHVERYPDALDFEGVHLPLSYHFAPGAEDDGVTLRVPASLLNQVDPQRCEWLVPGMLEDKVTALIRALPKPLRRNYVPAPDFARAACERIRFAKGALLDAVAGALHQISGVAMAADAWRLDALEPHFHMRFQVADGAGETLGVGRDLGALQARFSGLADAEFQALPRAEFERVGLCSWDFHDLPERVELQGPDWRVTAYPALAAEPDGVAVRVFDTPVRAEHAHRDGVLQLLALEAGLERVKLGRHIPAIQRMCLQYAGLGSCQDLQADLIHTALEQAFLADQSLPRARAEFDTLLADGKVRFSSELDRIAMLVAAVLERYVPLRKRVQGAVSPTLLQALADIRSQLDHLVFAGFVRRVPVARLAHYPRYLQALTARLEKLDQDPGRDRARAQRVTPLWAACLQQIGRYSGDESPPPALVRYRWLLEEYRVSIFAQELGTAEPVSEQRLAALWRTVA